MNKLNALLCSTALTATFMMGTHSAFAGVLTESASFGPAPTPITGDVLNLLGYTADGGTQPLLGVSVTMTDHVTGTITGTNTSTSTLSFSGSVRNTLHLTSQPSNLTLPNVIDISSPSGTVTLSPSSSFTTATLTGSNSATSAATGSLTDFLGAWSLTFNDNGSFDGSADSGINIGANTTGQVNVNVTYTYQDPTGAPEPMSLALLGVGLAGMGVVRRRHAKK